jgi:hypothetical protein
MTTDRIMARRGEGVGIKFPERNPAHADPDWYQRDLDDPIEDPDEPWFDPLPTARHRAVPTDL